MVKVKRKNFWKPVEINLKDSAPELLCFEELVDYKAIRGKNIYANYDDEEDSDISTNEETTKRKKKQKKNLASNKRKNSSDDEDQPKKKKKKKKKSKPSQPATSSEPLETEAENLQSDTDIDMSAWNSFSLPEPIMKALTDKKFTQPTEIQKLCLPEAMENKKDILGAAETGSGKTLAFAIPIVAALLEAQENGHVNGKLWALIITPTRELAIQVKNHIRDLCAFTNIKVQEIVGGLSSDKQSRKLNEKPEIVVGTPGRLWELFRLGDEHLSQINSLKFFVIDEADRMFEKNHFIELDNLLEQMHYDKVEKNAKQVFVFSATLTMIHDTPSYVYKRKKGKKKGSPKMTSDKKLSKFIESLGLKNPAIVDITKKNVLASGISESYVQCSLEDKDYYLYYLIKIHSGKKMVFCNSVNCVKRLHRLLNILQCNAKILFADMDQKQRLKNLDNFQKQSNSLIITTDVAARGLDIANIDYIIHYQVPKTAETYVHRSGRSVRGVSAIGTSILLCCPGETYHYNKIMKTLNKDVKLPQLEISAPEILSNAKQVVEVSRKIEFIETKMHNVQSNFSCIEKWAKEMDILVDEDEMPKKLDDGTRKSYTLEIKKLRAELNHLLKRPILPVTESLRYPRFETVQAFLKQRSCIKDS